MTSRYLSPIFCFYVTYNNFIPVVPNTLCHSRLQVANPITMWASKHNVLTQDLRSHPPHPPSSVSRMASTQWSTVGFKVFFAPEISP